MDRCETSVLTAVQCKYRYCENAFLFFIDIDECAEKLDDCDDMVTRCVNTPGSYICLCYQENYAWNGLTCVGKYKSLVIFILWYHYLSL